MNQELTGHDHRAFDDAMKTTSAASPALRDTAIAAAKRIAPLWPLQAFVAVNPLLGHSSESFEETAGRIGDVAGARLLPDGNAPKLRIKSVCDVAAGMTDEDWSRFAVNQISGWAGAYYDQGQAIWRNPWEKMTAFAAWREQAVIDKTPEIIGLKGFRNTIKALGPDPMTVIATAVETLNIPVEAQELYFHRLLSTISGWAGYSRYLGWIGELRGGEPENLIDLLAIRAAFDLAVYQSLIASPIGDNLKIKWAHSVSHWPMTPSTIDPNAVIAQNERENIYQDALIARMEDLAKAKAEAKTDAANDARPQAQAVFCIDVRSERYRRALETVNPAVHTIGFAGFFGFAIALDRAGDAGTLTQCPVLLEPGFTVSECDSHAAERKPRKTFSSLIKRFKNAAVSSFAFVEAWGGLFSAAIVRDAMRKPAREIEPLGTISADPCADHGTGIDLESRIATAKGALAAMTLTGDLARVVALVGHGSTTTNNPYAAGLDCGACGGNTGEANARVAAMVLNDPDVRAQLKADGGTVPDDTVFVAALHDTTTDVISILDKDAIPASHADDMTRLEQDFAEASRLTRLDRSESLGLADGDDVHGDIDARSRDWSEVRPEWGLAGCAAFIVAPRERTAGLDLGGRTFLHSYDHEADTESGILELIMTAPLVVGSWISLQYYASSVDNTVFGSGDKTLHNVVGNLGVLEGYGGDLRVGLPMQSIHDGEKLLHDALRLTAFIEAPIAKIQAILDKHAHVNELFLNGWLHLVAIEDEGKTFSRYQRDGSWKKIETNMVSAAPLAA